MICYNTTQTIGVPCTGGFHLCQVFLKDENLSAWVLICVISTHLDKSIQEAAKKQFWWNIQC